MLVCFFCFFFPEGKLKMPQACSHITVLAIVFILMQLLSCWTWTPRSFSSDICLQKYPLLVSPTIFKAMVVPDSKRSSFLLLSSPIYQAHWNDKCKTESSCCPWAGKKLVWSSEIQTKVCSWILQFHLVILFLNSELFCIHFDPHVEKPDLCWKMKKGPNTFCMKINVFNSADSIYHRHKYC